MQKGGTHSHIEKDKRISTREMAVTVVDTLVSILESLTPVIKYKLNVSFMTTIIGNVHFKETKQL